jgi:SAM-dependent methyltransferase
MGTSAALCPACSSPGGGRVDSWRDPVGGKSFDILPCRTCGLEFAWPFSGASPDWYSRSGLQEHGPPGKPNLRQEIFFRFGVPEGRVLDLGCGNGGFLIELSRRGYDAEGVDFDPAVVEQARMAGASRVRAEDVRGLFSNPPPEPYDAVCALELIEHIDDLAGLGAFLARCVRPGGFFYLTTPNRKRPLFWFREIMDRPPHHLTRWDLHCLDGFLLRFGFRRVRADTGQLPVRHVFNMLFYPILKGSVLSRLRPNAPGPAAGASSRAAGLAFRLRALGVGRLVSRVWGIFEGALFALSLPMTLPLWLFFKTRPETGVFIAALYRRGGEPLA